MFDAWRQETWDANDTVLVNDPASDPDVGDFFARLPEADYLQTWYDLRVNGGLGTDEQDAAQKSAVHAGTASIVQLDALGRTYRGLGLYDRAVSLHTKARAVRETALGPDHPRFYASQ